MIQVEWIRPAYLLLGALLPVVWWLHHRTLVDMAPGQLRWSTVVRCLVLCCVVMGVAGLTLGLPSDRQHMIVLMDRSASVSPEGVEAAYRLATTIAPKRAGEGRVSLRRSPGAPFRA